MMADLYIASADTGRYDWLGVGRTEDEARDALISAWQEHCRQDPCCVDPDALIVEEIYVFPAAFGQGFRDREPCPRP